MNFDALQQIFQAAWDQSEKSGWHEKFTLLREVVSFLRGGQHTKLEALVEEEIRKQKIRVYMEKLALIHSETSEAVEALRNPNWETDKTYYLAGDSDVYVEGSKLSIEDRSRLKPEGVASELADIVIRVGDLAVEMGIDLPTAIALKMAYNATRSFRHGGKRA